MPTIDIDKGVISINGVELEATNIHCEYERADILQQIWEILYPEVRYKPDEKEDMGSDILWRLKKRKEDMRALAKELMELAPFVDYRGYTDYGICLRAISYLRCSLEDDHK